MTVAFEGFTDANLTTAFNTDTLSSSTTVMVNGDLYPGTNTADDLLGQQDKLKEYSQNELDRLQISTQNLEQDYARMSMIRRSEYPKRNKIIWVLAIFVSIGVIVFASLYLQNVLNVKSGWIDLGLVLIVSALLITVIIVFLDINDRDPNDFSKLKQNGSKLIQINEANKSTSLTNISDTDLTKKGCSGSECCGPGSKWAEASQNCVEN